jgi:hypothetical protein
MCTLVLPVRIDILRGHADPQRYSEMNLWANNQEAHTVDTLQHAKNKICTRPV